MAQFRYYADLFPGYEKSNFAPALWSGLMPAPKKIDGTMRVEVTVNFPDFPMQVDHRVEGMVTKTEES